MGFKLQDSRIKRIERYCREKGLLAEGDGVVVGVSGGADSVFLLLFLWAVRRSWKLKLCVVHVNHGIRGVAAYADEEYVGRLAERLQLPFLCYKADIPALAKQWKMTEEEAGRHYRYQCFETVRKEYGFTKIAVAHHVNDQAETVLFQLFRGSSLRGLGGMQPKKDYLIRPLLDFSKEEILEALEEYGIEYCEDATNQENTYSRNYIRNELLPGVEKMVQKKVQDHIAANASYVRDVMSYVEEQTGIFWKDKVKKERNAYIIERTDFLTCHVVIQRELILWMIEALAGKKKDITGTHIEQVRNIFLGETGKRAMLPYHLIAKREYECLYVTLAEEEETCFLEKELRADGSYEIIYTNGEKRYFRTVIQKISEISESKLKKCCTKCFDYDKINSIALFRYPLAGDYFWLDKTGKKKKLSRFFIDEKVPADQRKYMIVLAEGNHVLWIPEFQRCSAFYYLSEETEQMLCIEEVQKNLLGEG